MRRIALAAALLAAFGCASKGMSKAECKLADWRAIGFEDGVRGAHPSAFGAHRSECAEHGVVAGFDDYMQGRSEGLESFCRPENGARLGAEGIRYTGVCPAHLERDFLAAHARTFGLWQRQAEIDRIDDRIHATRARSSEIEHLLVERGASLLAPMLTPAERARVALQIKQLTQEKIELEARIPRLEGERDQAVREYESYRRELERDELA